MVLSIILLNFMVPLMFRLSWSTSSGAYRCKYFTTVRQMSLYAKKECKLFSDRLIFSFFEKGKYHPFVLIGNKVCTLSYLKSLVFKLEVSE